jgi:hypothetical protein
MPQTKFRRSLQAGEGPAGTERPSTARAHSHAVAETRLSGDGDGSLDSARSAPAGLPGGSQHPAAQHALSPPVSLLGVEEGEENEGEDDEGGMGTGDDASPPQPSSSVSSRGRDGVTGSVADEDEADEESVRPYRESRQSSRRTNSRFGSSGLDGKGGLEPECDADEGPAKHTALPASSRPSAARFEPAQPVTPVAAAPKPKGAASTNPWDDEGTDDEG